MVILNNLLARVQAVQDGLESGDIVREVLTEHESDIMDMQYEQLFSGMASNGEDIRPYYSEDLKPNGYFYTVESAGMYAAWKQDINYPYEANRNPDAPNLYINGRFHSELGVQFGPEEVAVVPETPYAAKIVSKYGLSTFGLTVMNWAIPRKRRIQRVINKCKTQNVWHKLTLQSYPMP